MSRRKQLRQTVVIHDHFEGSAHCVECGGDCRLEGAELFATMMVRGLLESEARAPWMPYWFVLTFQEWGLPWGHLLERAKATNPRAQR